MHFYVWSPSELQRLVEACARAGSSLLGHLRHLMGCRESLEQLIYTSLSREVDRRHALAWTGRGLVVATSLRWYGRIYHWTRQVGRELVRLDDAFTQDLFDFKTTLGLTTGGAWAKAGKEAERHTFEIRSRFFDSLTAPYWRALWDELPDPAAEKDKRLANMIQRYRRTGRPNYLREYLRARVHALRWTEERLSKNREVKKPSLSIPDLRTFLLGTTSIADAAVEFLRLDQHVKTTDWVAEHLAPPADRVSSFASIPIRNVRATNRPNEVEAELDYDEYGIDQRVAAASCSLGEGAWVRLTPRPDGPGDGQSTGLLFKLGSTCTLDSIDWDTGRVQLSVIPLPHADQYRLQSNPRDAGTAICEHALLEESPSDYVAPHVDRRLNDGLGLHVFGWLDPTSPAIPEARPISDADATRSRELLEAVQLPTLAGDQGLSEDQRTAILQGIPARVQLLQGPPGTGKTQTSAVAVLLRVLLKCQAGDVVLVGGPTHRAVDNLLQRISQMSEAFRRCALEKGWTPPLINLAKVHSSDRFDPSGTGIADLAYNKVRPFNCSRDGAVLVLGGLMTGLLKAARFLRDKRTFTMNPDGTFAAALFVDEASMMVFPHFLALATLVSAEGDIIVAGDHRQLAPIVAHDWDREDRPPAVLYQPFVSAYEAVRNLGQDARVNERQVVLTALEYSFRLPPEIRSLISRIYREDSIELRGADVKPGEAPEGVDSPFAHVWQQPTGLFLIVHDEQESRRSNPLEAKILKMILEAGGDLPDDSVAIITPHRAQRILLQREIEDVAAVAMIDTVERLQGGERPTVLVSATASDPSAIAANVQFLLDLNRSNVAFSRAQERLVVVCSKSLIDHVPPEFEHYESAQLWKSLRHLCHHQLAETEIEGRSVRVMMCPREAL